jgi:hypothetical protein
MAPENMFAHALWLDRHASVEGFVLLENLKARVSALRARDARRRSRTKARVRRILRRHPVPVNPNKSLSIVDHVYCRRLAAQAVFQFVVSISTLYPSIYVSFSAISRI